MLTPHITGKIKPHSEAARIYLAGDVIVYAQHGRELPVLSRILWVIASPPRSASGPRNGTLRLEWRAGQMREITGDQVSHQDQR